MSLIDATLPPRYYLNLFKLSNLTTSRCQQTYICLPQKTICALALIHFHPWTSLTLITALKAPTATLRIVRTIN
eukprot:3523214-Pleurochrysis_carterae.AAC.2